MTKERPLHVRVAEALGCNPAEGRWHGEWECRCSGRTHAEHTINEDHCHSHSGLICERDLLARYDTEWSATGPLIEKYNLNVGRYRPGFMEGQWFAILPGRECPGAQAEALGDTPLIAVCNLLLALEEEGQLKPLDNVRSSVTL